MKPRRDRDHDEYYYMDDEPSARKIWPSDEDRVRWVADPAINRKAEDFIAKIHRNYIVSDISESQTVTVYPSGN